LIQIESRLEKLTLSIEEIAKTSEPCQRLMRQRGVGPITATAFAAKLADPAVFRNGRQVSAWLGLVPRQHSSGGRERLLGITKRGDMYLRKLLIHGARASLRHSARQKDMAFGARPSKSVVAPIEPQWRSPIKMHDDYGRHCATRTMWTRDSPALAN